MSAGKRSKKFLFVGAIFTAAMSLTSCAALARSHVAAAGTAGTSAENGLVAGINGYRAAHGLGPLSVNGVLVDKARNWAGHMAGGGCGTGGNGVPNICHSNLTDGITISWSRLEENVGMISPSSNVSGMEGAFEGSPGHSANMLNPDVHYVGVGVAYVGSYMYVAEEFMG